MKHWMFSCKEVSKKFSESMDRKLPFYHRMYIRIHMLMCGYCSRFGRQLLLLRELSRSDKIVDRSTNDPTGLSLEARERIKARLRV